MNAKKYKSKKYNNKNKVCKIILTVTLPLMVDHWSRLPVLFRARSAVPDKCLRAEKFSMRTDENEKGSFSALDEYKVDKFSMRTKERAVCKPVQLRVNSPRAEVILKVTVPQRPLPLDII